MELCLPWALVDAVQRRWSNEKMNMGQDVGMRRMSKLTCSGERGGERERETARRLRDCLCETGKHPGKNCTGRTNTLTIERKEKLQALDGAFNVASSSYEEVSSCKEYEEQQEAGPDGRIANIGRGTYLPSNYRPVFAILSANVHVLDPEWFAGRA